MLYSRIFQATLQLEALTLSSVIIVYFDEIQLLLLLIILLSLSEKS